MQGHFSSNKHVILLDPLLDCRCGIIQLYLILRMFYEVHEPFYITKPRATVFTTRVRAEVTAAISYHVYPDLRRNCIGRDSNPMSNLRTHKNFQALCF